MPELPEVETIKRSLHPKLVGRKIRDCEILYEKCIKTHAPEKFINGVRGATIENIERRGKYLKIFLNTAEILLIHLRMTGRLIISPKGDPVTKHTHVIFHLDNDLQLRFIDIRKFGTLYLLPGEELHKVRGYRILGPEPFGEEFTLEYFKKAVKERKKNIKTLLLDQDVVAGIGNIYADEILHAAGINPARPAESLNGNELEKLYHSIKRELKKGIENRGTSFSDYVDGEGRKGKNQDYLSVYHRQGCNCSRCGCEIIKTKLGGRSSHYCPGCQE